MDLHAGYYFTSDLCHLFVSYICSLCVSNNHTHLPKKVYIQYKVVCQHIYVHESLCPCDLYYKFRSHICIFLLTLMYAKSAQVLWTYSLHLCQKQLYHLNWQLYISNIQVLVFHMKPNQNQGHCGLYSENDRHISFFHIHVNKSYTIRAKNLHPVQICMY